MVNNLRNEIIFSLVKESHISPLSLSNLNLDDISSSEQAIRLLRKNGKVVYYTLPNELFIKLKSYLATLPPNQIPLFVNSQGSRLSRAAIMQIIKLGTLEKQFSDLFQVPITYIFPCCKDESTPIITHKYAQTELEKGGFMFWIDKN